MRLLHSTCIQPRSCEYVRLIFSNCSFSHCCCSFRCSIRDTKRTDHPLSYISMVNCVRVPCVMCAVCRVPCARTAQSIRCPMSDRDPIGSSGAYTQRLLCRSCLNYNLKFSLAAANTMTRGFRTWINLLVYFNFLLLKFSLDGIFPLEVFEYIFQRIESERRWYIPYTCSVPLHRAVKGHIMWEYRAGPQPFEPCNSKQESIDEENVPKRLTERKITHAISME